MNFVTRLIILPFAALLIHSCAQNEVSIAILHTNDVHGEIGNFGKIAALKTELQDKYDTVLLVSAGDMFSGNPYVDYHESKGFPMIDLMNNAGYNLAVLGNHEFDYGQDILLERMNQAHFPFLGANIDASKSILNNEILSFHEINMKDIQLVFSGLIETENNNKPSTHPAKVSDIEFASPTDKLSEITNHTSQSHLILLNHLGYFLDSSIAANNPEIEVIIGGHSHTTIDTTNLINGVLVAQTGHDLEKVGLIELKYKNGKLVSKNNQLIELASYTKIDSEVEKLVEKHLTNPELDKSIGKVISPMESMSQIGCLFTDAQRNMNNLDFVFQNYWGIRLSEVPVGDFKKALAYEIDPFGNNLIVFNLTKEEIESLLKVGFTEHGGKPMLISGGTYTINQDSNGNIVEINMLDDKGMSLHLNKTYTVGLNSYIANSYQFNHAEPGTSTNITTADFLIQYIQQIKDLDYNDCQRIVLEK